MLGAVGEGVGVDEAEAAEGVGVVLGEGEGDVSAHGVPDHDALVDTGFVEHFFDDFRHEIHGVDIGEGLAEAVAGEVDGDDTHVVHVGEDVGAPDVEALEESMEEDEGFAVFAAFVTVVDCASVDGESTMLFHMRFIYLLYIILYAIFRRCYSLKRTATEEGALRLRLTLP